MGEMTDHIKTSQVIQEFLDNEKIKIEVDEFAPVVLWALHAGKHGDYMVGQKCWTGYKYICPFYGLGGEGNLLKALQAWMKKKKTQWRLDFVWEGGIIGWRLYSEDTPEIYVAKGASHGIALADLLYKIATEEK
jgi:hypothetical protein